MGPGTELKRLLRRVGIHSTPQCLCDQRSIVMDEEGPEWCVDNISLICNWMQEECETRGIPFNQMIAKLFIMTAIRNAKKKERLLR